MRIATARMLVRPTRSIEGYVAEFGTGDRLDPLECDDAAVRRTFLHSYRHLDGDSRSVFRLLGLIAGPSFTASAVRALTGRADPDVRTVFARLAAGHLIEPVGEDRYRLHDLLRLYGTGALRRRRPDADPGGRRCAPVRLACLACPRRRCRLYPQAVQLPELATAPEPRVTFATRQDALDWLDAEQAGLVATVRACADEAQSPRSVEDFVMRPRLHAIGNPMTH